MTEKNAINIGVFYLEPDVRRRIEQVVDALVLIVDLDTGGEPLL